MSIVDFTMKSGSFSSLFCSPRQISLLTSLVSKLFGTQFDCFEDLFRSSYLGHALKVLQKDNLYCEEAETTSLGTWLYIADLIRRKWSFANPNFKREFNIKPAFKGKENLEPIYRLTFELVLAIRMEWITGVEYEAGISLMGEDKEQAYDMIETFADFNIFHNEGLFGQMALDLKSAEETKEKLLGQLEVKEDLLFEQSRQLELIRGLSKTESISAESQLANLNKKNELLTNTLKDKENYISKLEKELKTEKEECERLVDELFKIHKETLELKQLVSEGEKYHEDCCKLLKELEILKKELQTKVDLDSKINTNDHLQDRRSSRSKSTCYLPPRIQSIMKKKKFGFLSKIPNTSFKKRNSRIFKNEKEILNFNEKIVFENDKDTIDFSPHEKFVDEIYNDLVCDRLNEYIVNIYQSDEERVTKDIKPILDNEDLTDNSSLNKVDKTFTNKENHISNILNKVEIKELKEERSRNLKVKNERNLSRK